MSSVSPNMGLTLPDVNDTVADTIPDLAANFTKIDGFFPVGSVFLNIDGTNPGTVYGGTWTQIAQGRFIVGASVDYPAGSTGGSATHYHDKGPDKTNAKQEASQYVVSKGNNTGTASSIPPYLSMYVWQRTA